jgi:hypothetical protein
LPEGARELSYAVRRAAMTEPTAVSTERVQEWVNMLDYICQSGEIRRLLERLEKENHSFLQSDVKLEKE